MHISEEAENHHSNKEIWIASFSTFLVKLVIASTFIVPILFFDLYNSIIISIIWGMLLIMLFSIYLAKQQRVKHYKLIFEHVGIALLVVILTTLSN